MTLLIGLIMILYDLIKCSTDRHMTLTYITLVKYIIIRLYDLINRFNHDFI